VSEELLLAGSNATTDDLLRYFDPRIQKSILQRDTLYTIKDDGDVPDYVIDDVIDNGAVYITDNDFWVSVENSTSSSPFRRMSLRYSPRVFQPTGISAHEHFSPLLIELLETLLSI
jgi:hypothetical protein